MPSIHPRAIGPAILLTIATACTGPQGTRVIEHFQPAVGNITLDAAGTIVIPASERGYLAVLPKTSIDGSILFIQGNRVDTTSDLEELSVLPAAEKAHLAVVFLSTGNPLDFLFHDSDLARTDDLVQEALAAAGLSDKPCVLAGLSLAGTRAMRLARYCQEGRSTNKWKPAGVALCDSPLDMVRFWREDEKAKVRDASAIATNEATWVNACLERELGGTPNTALEAYLRYSPYSYSDPDSTALVPFRNLPLRAYHEPDVDWWMANRGKDYYAMNSVDLAALVNELRLMGNDRAELITSVDKRMFPSVNSPHTWKIIDPVDLVKWVSDVVRS